MSTPSSPRTSGAVRPSDDRFQRAETGLLVADLGGDIMIINPAMAALLDLAPEQAIGANLFELLSPPEQICEVMEALIGTGLSSERVVSLECSTGTRQIVLSTALLPAPGLTGRQEFLATARPADDTRNAPDTSQDATIFAASARLSRLVSHDLNNALGVLLGACHLLDTSRHDHAADQRDLDSLVTAGTEAALLVRQLAAYGSARPSAPVPLAPDAELRRLVPVVSKLLARPVDFHLRADTTGGTLLADPDVFEDVVLTLALEARRTLGTSDRVLIQLASSPAGDEWQLRVSAPAPRVQTLPPRHTRPAAGPPTGLSGLGRLAIERWLTEQGGRVEIDHDAPGFVADVAWPRRQGGIRVATPTPRPASAADARVVLVVDDNLRLSQFVEQVLVANGYEVVVVADGSSALDAIAGRRFDAVVTDILMPDISGWQVGEAARQHDASCGIVYVTGELVDVGAGVDAQACSDQLLLKPFTPARLLETVARACAHRTTR